MSDQTESAPADSVDATQASEAAPENTDGQPTSSSPPLTQKDVDEQIRRALQADRDRNNNRQEKRIDDKMSLLQQYAAATGQTIDPVKLQQVQRDAYIDQMIATQQPPAPVAQASPTGAPSSDGMELAKAMELDTNDAEVIAVLAQQGNKAANLMAYKNSKGSLPTSSAALPGSGGGTTPADDVQGRLLEQRQKEYTTTRGNPQVRMAVKKKYRNLGLLAD